MDLYGPEPLLPWIVHPGKANRGSSQQYWRLQAVSGFWNHFGRRHTELAVLRKFGPNRDERNDPTILASAVAPKQAKLGQLYSRTAANGIDAHLSRQSSVLDFCLSSDRASSLVREAVVFGDPDYQSSRQSSRIPDADVGSSTRW